MAGLPPYASAELVAARLPLIFPEGMPHRGNCTRKAASVTVFTALYIGAVEGRDRWFAPAHAYRMTLEQAELPDAVDRLRYDQAIRRKKGRIPGDRIYADNSREQIRDEALREGLVTIGAVVCRLDLPTTSSTPRYALKAEFAALLDPALEGAALEAAIALFQASHLSVSARAQLSIMRSGAAGGGAGERVTFPNGDTRLLAPGPSSVIAKAVIEVFAPRFLATPAVLWLSESGNKVVLRDDRLASAIGLRIEADRELPDLILADVGPSGPLLVFVELVATDGAITPRRQAAIHRLTDEAGFDRARVTFLTAYQHRASAGFKKTIGQLAWSSFAWIVAEPDRLIVMRESAPAPGRLTDLLGSPR